ncbi:hypothetical protein F5Y09DRAFT_294019 [Xylaria sp. FL1042]|nr:hypothetical protein F5Y09DRAFT_294019 [Xylaria sp. FL1042]
MHKTWMVLVGLVLPIVFFSRICPSVLGSCSVHGHGLQGGSVYLGCTSFSLAAVPRQYEADTGHGGCHSLSSFYFYFFGLVMSDLF